MRRQFPAPKPSSPNNLQRPTLVILLHDLSGIFDGPTGQSAPRGHRRPHDGMQEGPLLAGGKQRHRKGARMASQARERQGLVEGGGARSVGGPGGDTNRNRRRGGREAGRGEPGQGGQRDGFRQSQPGIFELRAGGRRLRRVFDTRGGFRRRLVFIVRHERRRQTAQRGTKRCHTRDPREPTGRFHIPIGGIRSRLRVSGIRARARISRRYVRHRRIHRRGGDDDVRRPRGLVCSP
mmetsp:Transcript_38655/g.93077  ORF Transcript_38655/g.93077 Transcript_38655/m.93077 type:complete len:236 (-) Transcript_38655:493-1200(-)